MAEVVRLQQLVDPNRGGAIRSRNEIDAFVQLMKDSQDMHRHMLSQALIATSHDKPMITSLFLAGGASVLATWMVEAIKGKKTILLRHLLEVISKVTPDFSIMQALGKAVNKATKYPEPDIAKMASSVKSFWSSHIAMNQPTLLVPAKPTAAAAAPPSASSPENSVPQTKRSGTSGPVKRPAEAAKPTGDRLAKVPARSNSSSRTPPVVKDTSVQSSAFANALAAKSGGSRQPRPSLASLRRNSASSSSSSTARVTLTASTGTKPNRPARDIIAQRRSSDSTSSVTSARDTSAATQNATKTSPALPSKKRKRVTFAEGDALVRTKIYEVDEAERAHKRRPVAELEKEEHQKEKMMHLQIRKQEIRTTVAWRQPEPSDMPPEKQEFVHGKDSTESKTQQWRHQRVPPSDFQQDSPTEPPPEQMQDDVEQPKFVEIPLEPKPVPVEDITSDFKVLEGLDLDLLQKMVDSGTNLDGLEQLVGVTGQQTGHAPAPPQPAAPPAVVAGQHPMLGPPVVQSMPPPAQAQAPPAPPATYTFSTAAQQPQHPQPPQPAHPAAAGSYTPLDAYGRGPPPYRSSSRDSERRHSPGYSTGDRDHGRFARRDRERDRPPRDGRARTPCRFYRTALGCRNGERCPFLHE